MSHTYSLTVCNNSTLSTNFILYQTDPNITDTNVFSLAWFSQFANPRTQLNFHWNVTYNFVWYQTGLLKPGAKSSASEILSADLSTSNEVTLTYNGGYNFVDQKVGPTSGTLFVTEDGTIPNSSVAVGIGMSGFGTFVAQGAVNYPLTFVPVTPAPLYWITYGNYHPGDVLDLASITHPASIIFPTNVYSMTAILQTDNTWAVHQTEEVNAAYLKKRATDPYAIWGQ